MALIKTNPPHLLAGVYLECELMNCKQRTYEIPAVQGEAPTVTEAMAAEREHLKRAHRIDWPKVMAALAEALDAVDEPTE